MIERYSKKEHRIERDPKCCGGAAVKCNAISSGNVLSKSEKELVAISPEVHLAKVPASGDPQNESQKDNPQELAVSSQLTHEPRCSEMKHRGFVVLAIE